MYLYALTLTDDALADLREEFNMRFELTDKKIQANLDEIRSTSGKLEEYHSEFLLTARNLEAKFTEDLTNTESRITQEYTSAIDISARGLKAEFTSGLADLGTGITEAYKSAIGISARELRADFSASVSDLDGRMSAHAGGFHVTAEKIESMVSATNSLKGTVEQHTSAISQTASRIDQFVQKITFDSKGNITNIDKAGLVTEGNIATMFAEKVDPNGDIVRRAQISSFITQDEAGDIISNATIQADRINFTGKTIINGRFVVDAGGNLFLNDITANNLTLKGNISGIDAILNDVVANNLTLTGIISGTDATLNDITASNLILKGDISGADAALNDITANNLTLKGSITGRDAVLNDITANNLTLTGNISGADAVLNDITANNLILKGNISGTNAVLNDITANGTINASGGRIGDYLYLHGNGISTNPKAFVTDLTDGTTQFELSKSYYLHAIASDGGANSILIRPYQTMEAGTVKGVVTISATIPGRNRVIHVSSGESYFGGDVIVGKMYAPSSGTLEIAGPLKTVGPD